MFKCVQPCPAHFKTGIIHSESDTILATFYKHVMKSVLSGYTLPGTILMNTGTGDTV